MAVLYCTRSPIFFQGGRYYSLGLQDVIRDYHAAFGKLDIIAGTKPFKEGEPYADITDYVGNVHTVSKRDSALRTPHFRQIVEMALSGKTLAIVRVQSGMGDYVASAARKKGIPYLAEVVSCGWATMWHHSLKGKLVAPASFLSMRNTIRNADFALYVTGSFLQRRYPTHGTQTAVSDVAVEPLSQDVKEAIMSRLRDLDRLHPTLFTTGAAGVKYKGQQFVIQALSLLRKRGIDAKYYVIGQGDVSRLKKIARKCGVENRVFFTGHLPYAQFVDLYSQGGIYIQPSLTEGLPRALVEAMNRGLPSLGSDIGGIPELLPSDSLFKPGNPKDIANAIEHMLKEDLPARGNMCMEKAQQYRRSVLAEKRERFYKKIISMLNS